MRFRAQSWTDGGPVRHNTLPQTQPQPPMIEIEEEKPRTGPKAIVLTQGKTFFLLLASWALLVLYIKLPQSSNTGSLGGVPHTDPLLPPANLHVLVSARRPDPNVCRAIVSAAVVGYPSAVVFNLVRPSEGADDSDDGGHLAKITSVHDYLATLDANQDEDLIFMMDGEEAWMQLRPQTLIDRYFEINSRANARIAKDLGDAAKKFEIRQEIIFGSDKRCWPLKKEDPACYAVPSAGLPEDVYGMAISPKSGGARSYVKYRQRFLNAGVAIGTVRAMRKLITQAVALLETEKGMDSDQRIFSQILGEQEVWREAVRRDSSWDPMKVREKLGMGDGIKELEFDPKHLQEVRAKAAANPNGTFEFGIGLDYGGRVVFNTAFAEDDADWLTWGETASLGKAQGKLDIASKTGLVMNSAPPQDIVSTPPPFWTFSYEKRLPRWTEWVDTPLLTNIWTGNVPVVVHHSAPHDDKEPDLRQTWWENMWFSKYARVMYDVSIYDPILPVAYSGSSPGQLREYWPSETWKGGGRNGSGPWDPHDRGFALETKWISYDSICHNYHEEVFADGKGIWLLPNVH